MTLATRALRASAVALAAALAVAAALFVPIAAHAAEPGIYTATTVPTYANPATGVIEDSGGASNQALGESMVSGTTYDKALIEVDSAGNAYATLRFKLIDQIGDMQFEVSSDGGATFASVEREQMQTDTAQNTGDFRFAIPDENTVMRVHMDVTPMGRAVVFFVSFSDLVAGNSDTFVQTVDPTAAVAGEEGEASSDEQAASNEAAANVSAGAAAEEPAPTADGASTTSGVQEFDADGNDVTGGKNAQQGLDATTIAIVVGVVVVVAAVAGGIVYAVRIRPQRARAAQAAAAAAASAAKPAVGADPKDDKSGEAEPKSDDGALA